MYRLSLSTAMMRFGWSSAATVVVVGGVAIVVVVVLVVVVAVVVGCWGATRGARGRRLSVEKRLSL